MANTRLFSQSNVIGSNLGNSIITNPSTQMAYCMYPANKTIVVINVAAQTVVTTITLAYQPSYMALNTTTNMLYVTIANAYVAIINCNTNSVSTYINLPANGGQLGINQVTNYIYVIGSSNTIYCINGANNAVSTITLYSGGVTNYASGNSLVVDSSANRVYVLMYSSTGSALYMNVISGTSYYSYVAVSSTASTDMDASIFFIPGSTYLYVAYQESSGSLLTIKYYTASSLAYGSTVSGAGLGTGLASAHYGNAVNNSTSTFYILTNIGLISFINGNGTSADLFPLPYSIMQNPVVNEKTNTMYAYYGGNIYNIDLFDGSFATSSATSSQFFTLCGNNVVCALQSAAGGMYIYTYASMANPVPDSGKLAVLSGGNKLQSGKATTNTSYYATVYFPVPFATIPLVTANPIQSNACVAVGSVGTASFVVYSYTAGGANLASCPFSWSAIGT